MAVARRNSASVRQAAAPHTAVAEQAAAPRTAVVGRERAGRMAVAAGEEAARNLAEALVAQGTALGVGVGLLVVGQAAAGLAALALPTPGSRGTASAAGEAASFACGEHRLARASRPNNLRAQRAH